jgi:hypothetical protein
MFPANDFFLKRIERGTVENYRSRAFFLLESDFSSSLRVI